MLTCLINSVFSKRDIPYCVFEMLVEFKKKYRIMFYRTQLISRCESK